MKKLIRLHIGDYYASQEPTVINTTLGSCVSVCLFDPVAGVGGMNHILLPGRGDLDKFNPPARYGINAMELLINAILSLGGVRSRLKAKAFGGAHLLAAISLENGTGHLNVEFVERFLKTEKIRLIARDTGGRRSRQIWFHTDTGEVLVKGSPLAMEPDVAKAEHHLVKRQRQAVNQPAEITLFE